MRSSVRNRNENSVCQSPLSSVTLFSGVNIFTYRAVKQTVHICDLAHLPTANVSIEHVRLAHRSQIPSRRNRPTVRTRKHESDGHGTAHVPAVEILVEGTAFSKLQASNSVRRGSDRYTQHCYACAFVPSSQSSPRIPHSKR
jgi:hypothetical protein